MSTATAVKKEPGLATLVIVLLVISVVTSLLLGLANELTAPAIAENERATREAAMSAVLPADGYTEIEYTGSDSTVDAVYQAGDAGYVVEVSPTGSFSGTFTIMVGVDNSGTVTGVEVVSSGETSGLGSNASKPAFKDQFKGVSESTAVTKDGGAIDAITGATITSRCMSNGVNTAMAVVAELG